MKRPAITRRKATPNAIEHPPARFSPNVIPLAPNISHATSCSMGDGTSHPSAQRRGGGRTGGQPRNCRLRGNLDRALHVRQKHQRGEPTLLCLEVGGLRTAMRCIPGPLPLAKFEKNSTVLTQDYFSLGQFRAASYPLKCTAPSLREPVAAVLHAFSPGAALQLPPVPGVRHIADVMVGLGEPNVPGRGTSPGPSLKDVGGFRSGGNATRSQRPSRNVRSSPSPSPPQQRTRHSPSRMRDLFGFVTMGIGRCDFPAAMVWSSTINRGNAVSVMARRADPWICPSPLGPR